MDLDEDGEGIDRVTRGVTIVRTDEEKASAIGLSSLVDRCMIASWWMLYR